MKGTLRHLPCSSFTIQWGCSGVEAGGTAPVRRQFAGCGLPAHCKVVLLNGAVPQRIQLLPLLLLPRSNPRRKSSGRLITSWWNSHTQAAAQTRQSPDSATQRRSSWTQSSTLGQCLADLGFIFLLVGQSYQLHFQLYFFLFLPISLILEEKKKASSILLESPSPCWFKK